MKKKVENDSRASIARESFLNRIKIKNGFKEVPANYDAMVGTILAKIPDTGKEANTFKAADFTAMDKTLFSIGKMEYRQSDFLTFAESVTRGRLMGNKKAVIKDIYNLYVNNVVTDYEEHNMLDQRPEFRAMMDEYKDGIMLFELMDRNVWRKVSKDTTGLKAFYEKNKGKYM